MLKENVPVGSNVILLLVFLSAQISGILAAMQTPTYDFVVHTTTRPSILGDDIAQCESNLFKTLSKSKEKVREAFGTVSVNVQKLSWANFFLFPYRSFTDFFHGEIAFLGEVPSRTPETKTWI